MSTEDYQLDPETRALETELGSLTPLTPSEALCDRIFASMEAGDVFEDTAGVEISSRAPYWWLSAAVPFASAAAIALFVVLSPATKHSGSPGVVSAESSASEEEVHGAFQEQVSSLAPGVSLTRASMDQQLVDRRAEIVGTEDNSAFYRKVQTYQTERIRFFDKTKGVEVVAEVPCEEVRLEQVEAY